MSPRKIAVVTAARSEYGLLRWLLEETRADESLELQLVVTGAHLSSEFGSTYKEIEADGFKIAAKVDMLINSDLPKSVAKSMGVCCMGMAEVFDRLRPEVLVVLGDRYELLPIASVALVLEVPIAHISGGDVTEGAIDNEIRNAVSMMATLHFPGTTDSAERLISMGVSPRSIFPVGEPGLENFRRLHLIERRALCADLGLDAEKDWVLLSYHPETRISTEQNREVLDRLLGALESVPGIQIIASYANADPGGTVLNNRLEQEHRDFPDRFFVFASLGQLRYCSLLSAVSFMIGNSSSGVVEAPFLGVRSIIVGDRQRGRHIAPCVSLISRDEKEIRSAVENAVHERMARRRPDMYYGDGFTSKKIKDALGRWLLERPAG